MSDLNIICNKYLLTVKEASDYFGIGENKLYELVNRNQSAGWIVWNGTRALIKRKLFEKYLDSVNVI